MTSPRQTTQRRADALAAIEDAQRDLSRTLAAVATAETVRREAIRQAIEAGVTVTDIAATVGCSRQHVYTLIR